MPRNKSKTNTGNKITIAFTHTGSGLMVKEGNEVKGFEIAGADKKFVVAQAVITGDKIIVGAEGILHPVAVRYNWANDASAGNVFNKEGLPMAPFRSDDWQGVTLNAKYTVGL